MKNFTICVFLLASVTLNAQGFLPGFDRFSSKKIAYITLSDGTEIEGTIEDIDRKKGNTEDVFTSFRFK